MENFSETVGARVHGAGDIGSSHPILSSSREARAAMVPTGAGSGRWGGKLEIFSLPMRERKGERPLPPS